MVPPDLALGLAALSVALHNTRILANLGHASPADIEAISEIIDETVSAGGPPLAASVEANLAPVLAHMRAVASSRRDA